MRVLTATSRRAPNISVPTFRAHQAQRVEVWRRGDRALFTSSCSNEPECRSMRMTGSRDSRRGSVIVEFTLSATFLVALFLGVWQFGYAFLIYGELEEAVRAGARYASMRTYDSADATPTSAF